MLYLDQKDNVVHEIDLPNLQLQRRCNTLEERKGDGSNGDGARATPLRNSVIHLFRRGVHREVPGVAVVVDVLGVAPDGDGSGFRDVGVDGIDGAERVDDSEVVREGFIGAGLECSGIAASFVVCGDGDSNVSNRENKKSEAGRMGRTEVVNRSQDGVGVESSSPILQVDIRYDVRSRPVRLKNSAKSATNISNQIAEMLTCKKHRTLFACVVY